MKGDEGHGSEKFKDSSGPVAIWGRGRGGGAEFPHPPKMACPLKRSGGAGGAPRDVAFWVSGEGGKTPLAPDPRGAQGAGRLGSGTSYVHRGLSPRRGLQGFL